MLKNNSEVEILVVDDSAVARLSLARAISETPGLRIGDFASNGREALLSVQKKEPGIIILDLEMPEMDGMATLKVLHKDYPQLPVVIFSSLSKTGAQVTIDALSAGADAYALKPSSLAGNSIKAELIPLLIALASNIAPSDRKKIPSEKSLPKSAASALSTFKADVIVIGVSTGGPKILTTIIEKLPKNLGVPVLIVQHMPATFTQMLAQRLNSLSLVSVQEAIDGEEVRKGTVYIAQGGKHLKLARIGGRTLTVTTESAPENGCRPSADVLFRSTSDIFTNKTLGIVLTGMGRDGLLGARAIHSKGGMLIVQSLVSSTVKSMPETVLNASLGAVEISPDQIALAMIKAGGYHELR